MLKFSAMRVCKAVLLVFLFALPSGAHPVPFSYLDVQLQARAIDVSVTAHIYDLAHDLQITPMERLLEPAFLAERQDAIRVLLAPRFGIVTDDHPVRLVWSQPEILQERQSVRFHLRQAISVIPGVVSIWAKMFPYDPQHQTFVNVYESDVLASQMILDINHTQTDYFAETR